MNRAILNGMVLGFMLLSGALAQPPPQTLKPVTVCDVLMNQETYNGKYVALIGRSSRGDEGHWLTEATCDRKLETNGFVWPNMIWVECCRQITPDRPSGSLLLDEPALIEKLARLRSSTKLGLQQVYTVTDGKVELTDVRETWAVVYGMVEAKKKLETVLDGRRQVIGAGFGQLNLAPVQILLKDQSVQLITDEQYPTKSK